MRRRTFRRGDSENTCRVLSSADAVGLRVDYSFSGSSCLLVSRGRQAVESLHTTVPVADHAHMQFLQRTANDTNDPAAHSS